MNYNSKDTPVGKNAPSVCRRMKAWIKDALTSGKKYTLRMEVISDKELFVKSVAKLTILVTGEAWWYEASCLQALMCLTYPKHIMCWFFQQFGYIMWTGDHYNEIRKVQDEHEAKAKVQGRYPGDVRQET